MKKTEKYKNSINVRLRQCEKIKILCVDNSFGIEKYFRAFIAIIRFISPQFWIIHFLGKKSEKKCLVGTDIIVFSKLLISVLLLFFYRNLPTFFVAVIVFYVLMFDTLTSILDTVFNTVKGIKKPVSYTRSLLLLF